LGSRAQSRSGRLGSGSSGSRLGGLVRLGRVAARQAGSARLGLADWAFGALAAHSFSSSFLFLLLLSSLLLSLTLWSRAAAPPLLSNRPAPCVGDDEISCSSCSIGCRTSMCTCANGSGRRACAGVPLCLCGGDKADSRVRWRRDLRRRRQGGNRARRRWSAGEVQAAARSGRRRGDTGRRRNGIVARQGLVAAPCVCAATAQGRATATVRQGGDEANRPGQLVCASVPKGTSVGACTCKVTRPRQSGSKRHDAGYTHALGMAVARRNGDEANAHTGDAQVNSGGELDSTATSRGPWRRRSGLVQRQGRAKTRP
jgi:hypothetical protein